MVRCAVVELDGASTFGGIPVDRSIEGRFDLSTTTFDSIFRSLILAVNYRFYKSKHIKFCGSIGSTTSQVRALCLECVHHMHQLCRGWWVLRCTNTNTTCAECTNVHASLEDVNVYNTRKSVWSAAWILHRCCSNLDKDVCNFLAQRTARNCSFSTGIADVEGYASATQVSRA